jgi:hypothetical protein
MNSSEALKLLYDFASDEWNKGNPTRAKVDEVFTFLKRRLETLEKIEELISKVDDKWFRWYEPTLRKLVFDIHSVYYEGRKLE